MSKISSWSVVVFDLDDTLYLERDYVLSCFRAVGYYCQTIGLEDTSSRLVEMFDAGVRGNTFDLLLQSLGMDDADLLVAMVDIYRHHVPDIELAPDARRYLARVGDSPSALITDGWAASQRAKIQALALEESIGSITVTSELGPDKSKPHPEAFELIEAKFGLKGPDLVYIADNPLKDFAAPHALGWRTIRVRRQGSLHELVDTGDDVDIEISSLDEILHT